MTAIRLVLLQLASAAVIAAIVAVAVSVIAGLALLGGAGAAIGPNALLALQMTVRRHESAGSGLARLIVGSVSKLVLSGVLLVLVFRLTGDAGWAVGGFVVAAITQVVIAMLPTRGA